MKTLFSPLVVLIFVLASSTTAQYHKKGVARDSTGQGGTGRGNRG